MKYRRPKIQFLRFAGLRQAYAAGLSARLNAPQRTPPSPSGRGQGEGENTQPPSPPITATLNPQPSTINQVKHLCHILGFAWFIFIIALAIYLACTVTQYHDRDDA